VRERGSKLALLLVVGALVLNFPVLAIFNRSATVAGVPLLYLYLFGVWLAGIAAVYVLCREGGDDAGTAGDDRQ
jgi:hypothetical protein